jgi:hypothetical protein
VNILQFYSSRVNQVAELVVKLVLCLVLELKVLKYLHTSNFMEPDRTSLVKSNEHFTTRPRLQKANGRQFSVSEFHQFTGVHFVITSFLISRRIIFNRTLIVVF